MCAAEERRPCGGSRRGLSEAPQGPSSAAARMVEYRREVRSPGALGSPSLWLLSLGETRESDLPPGNPRRPCLKSKSPSIPLSQRGKTCNARRAGAPGSPFLWLLSFGETKESD